MLETIKRSAPARIINVASEMHAKSLIIEKLINDVNYKPMKVYGASKLAVIMLTFALARKLSGTAVTVNAVHPGVIYTHQSARMAPTFFRPLLKLFMSSPEKGALPSLKLAMDSSLDGVTGQYYYKETKKQTGPFSMDIEYQEKLYEKSLIWGGLK